MKLLVVLDYPTAYTKKYNAPLIGKEKQIFDALISAIKYEFDTEVETKILFALEQKPANKVAYFDELKQGQLNILEQCLEWDPDKILTMGNFAYQVLQSKYDDPPRVYSIRGYSWECELFENKPYAVATIPIFYCTGDPKDIHRFRWIESDFRKLFEQDKPFNLQDNYTPDDDLFICESTDDVDIMLDQLSTASIVSFDVETTGLNFWEDHLTAIGFAAKSITGKVKAFVIPHDLIYKDKVWILLYDFFESCVDYPDLMPMIVAHNAKFDLKMMIQYFESEFSFLNLRYRDTLVMNYQLDERKLTTSPSPHGLKTLSRFYFDDVDYGIDFNNWPENPTDDEWEELYIYLGKDVVYTYLLHEILLSEMEDEWYQMVKLHDNLLAPLGITLAYMELRGILIDKDKLNMVGEELQKEMNIAKEGFYTALQSIGADEEFVAEFNPNSYKQVRIAIYDLFKIPNSYKRGSDKDTLKQITIDHKKEYPEATDFIFSLLVYREKSKIISTYVDSITSVADGDDRIHPEFHIPGTSTGRLSGSNPNPQNIPYKMKEIRKAFIAPPGYAFVVVDQSQMEIRVAGFLSKDKAIYDAYKNDRDIHKEVASAAFRIPYDEVTDTQRSQAKSISFGVIYGRSPYGLINSPELAKFDLSEKEAQSMIDNFLNQFEGFKLWIEEKKRNILTTQYVSMPNGRKRRFPLILPHTHSSANRQAVNAPIQGLASDFTAESLVALEKKYHYDPDVRVICTVHDEIDLYVKIEVMEEKIPEIIEIMETSHPVDNFDMPLSIDAESGYNWSELESWEEFIK